MVALLISFIATLNVDFEQKQNCSTEERFLAVMVSEIWPGGSSFPAVSVYGLFL